MDPGRGAVLDVCVSGSWRGALAGVVWALPAVAIHPGIFLVAGVIAAVVGSLLGVIAAAPAGAAIHRGASRIETGLIGATAAVALWVAIVLPLYVLFDVRGGYLNYFTLGPAAVGAAFGCWNAVAHHRSAGVPPTTRSSGQLTRAWFVGAALALIATMVGLSRVWLSGSEREEVEYQAPAPVSCQERSGGDSSCPGG